MDAEGKVAGEGADRFGYQIVSGGSGDLDLIVAAPGPAGTVHVFEGPLPSMSTTFDLGDAALSITGHELEGSGTSGYTGWAVAAGDFDGDGEDELAIGACAVEGWDGAVYLMDTHGQNGAIDTQSATTRFAGTSAGWTGCTLANGGDLNNDGYSGRAGPSTRPSGAGS